MTTIFFGKDGKIRSGWRASIFIFAFLAPAIFIGVIIDLITKYRLFGFRPNSASLFSVSSFLMLCSALLVGWACGKLLEGLPFRSLGASFTGKWLKHLALGIVIGAATLGIAVLVAIIFGGLSFERNMSDGAGSILYSMAASFVVFAVAAAFEEALFRGYVLQTFSRSGLAWLAIALTSLFFGATHLGNPNSGLIATANTVLAGIWFSLAYLKTRDLWFVWGIHLMWNFAQGSLLGIEVSGMTELTSAPIFREIDAGPTWLTGTTYGIEGGVACTVALIVSIIAIHFMPLKSGTTCPRICHRSHR